MSNIVPDHYTGWQTGHHVLWSRSSWGQVHTSNRSSSQRCSCSSYGVFLELTKVESSDQEGKETQVSFSTYTGNGHRHFGVSPPHGLLLPGHTHRT